MVLPSLTVSVVGAAVVVVVVVDVVVPVVGVVVGVVVVVAVVLNAVVVVVEVDVVVVADVAAPQDVATNDRASRTAQIPVSHLILLGNRFLIFSPYIIAYRMYVKNSIIYFSK